MIKRLEMSFDQFRELHDYCIAADTDFISTPFDMDSIEFLATLDMPFWKIPSGGITDYPYLVALARTGKPVMLSTGKLRNGEDAQGIEILLSAARSLEKLVEDDRCSPEPQIDLVRLLPAVRTLHNYIRNQDIAGITDLLEDVFCPMTGEWMIGGDSI